MSAATVPYYRSSNRDFTLLLGDCCELLRQFDFKFDMVFADPPYFLSNGGISYQAGKVVCVDKGEWDRGIGREAMDAFNREWLLLCRDKLKPGGSLWVSGTMHNIFSVARQLLELGYKILNVITWVKTNPPPNISCRYFTHSTEFVIWARPYARVPHTYNYQLMRAINGDRQMTDVWRMPAIGRWEKSCGKHPTQKPLPLLSRIIMACTQAGGWVLDPCCGSSTTGIAASLLGRRYLGIDIVGEYLELSRRRRDELDTLSIAECYRRHLPDLQVCDADASPLVCEPLESGCDLPF